MSARGGYFVALLGLPYNMMQAQLWSYLMEIVPPYKLVMLPTYLENPNLTSWAVAEYHTVRHAERAVMKIHGTAPYFIEAKLTDEEEMFMSFSPDSGLKYQQFSVSNSNFCEEDANFYNFSLKYSQCVLSGARKRYLESFNRSVDLNDQKISPCVDRTLKYNPVINCESKYLVKKRYPKTSENASGPDANQDPSTFFELQGRRMTQEIIAVNHPSSSHIPIPLITSNTGSEPLPYKDVSSGINTTNTKSERKVKVPQHVFICEGDASCNMTVSKSEPINEVDLENLHPHPLHGNKLMSPPPPPLQNEDIKEISNNVLPRKVVFENISSEVVQPNPVNVDPDPDIIDIEELKRLELGKEGDNIIAYIHWWEEDGTVGCSNEQDFDRYEVLRNKIKNLEATGTFDHPIKKLVVNSMVIAYFDGVAHRAVVTAVGRNGDRCKVYFVDFGNTETFHISEVFQFHETLKLDPILCTLCSVKGLEKDFENQQERIEMASDTILPYVKYETTVVECNRSKKPAFKIEFAELTEAFRNANIEN